MLNLPDKLSPLLYLGKATDFQKCPKYYYWHHHLHLEPQVKAQALTFGSFCHKIFLEIGLLHGFQVAEALLTDQQDHASTLGYTPTFDILELLGSTSKDDKDLCLKMLDAFQAKWCEAPREVFGVEKTVKFPITHLTTMFTDWCVKADILFKEGNDLWIGDLKTTAAYGSSIAKYYHSSPQTKAYFWVLSQLMPNLRGTKIFVVTKQKIRCEEEVVLLTEADKYEAELFIRDSVESISWREEDFQDSDFNPMSFPRSMTQCINHYGQECCYMPICIQPIKSEAYLQDLLTSWYKDSDPDEHLELSRENA